MDGRTDLPQYYQGCRILENMVVKPTGGGTLRPGFEHIYGAYSDSYASTLIGFVNKTDRYILEFSESKMRVFKVGAILGAPYELATPWTAAEAAELVFAPRGAAIFHPDHDPYELTCDGDTDWTLTAFAAQYGPFLKANDNTSLTLTPSATSGNDKTLTASAALFDVSDSVGALFEITHDVDEVELSGVFDNEVEPPYTQNETSGTVTLKGRWDVKVQWHGWGKLKLQRSDDAGVTWKTVKTWDKPISGNDMAIQDAGQEDDDDILFRFYIDWSSLGNPDDLYDGSLVVWIQFHLTLPYCHYSIKATNTSQTGIVRVTAVASTTSATINILNDLGAVTATDQWKEGAWSPYRGYPKCGTVHEGRIYAARTTHKPTTIWCGRPFLRREDARLFYGGSTVEADDAFWRTIDQEDCDTIEWLVSLWVMLIGSNGNLIKAIGPSENQPMTPKDTNFLPQSGMGSADLQPVRIAGNVAYCGRSSKRVYEMTYSDDTRVYNPEDLTRYAEHITGSGITGWAFQQQPYPILWAVTSDGDLIGLTRDRQQELLAWHKHTTDGTFESVAVIPSDGDDEVWVSVARTVNGSTVRSIERMKSFDWGTSQRDCFFVDAGSTWDGGAAVTVTGIAVDAGTDRVTVTAASHGFTDGWTVKLASVAGMTDVNENVYTVADKGDNTFVLKTRDGSGYIDGSAFGTYTSGGTVERVANSVTGLTQLAGVSVSALLDGQPKTGTVSAAGVYTIGTRDRHYHNTIHVGRSYTGILSPMRPEVRTASGSVQGQDKRITSCAVRLYQSAGGRIGTNATDAIPILYRERGDELNADVTLVTKDMTVEPPGGWTKEGDIYIDTDTPLPFEVSAILFGMET